MKPASPYQVDVVVSALEREGLVYREGDDIVSTEKGIDEANAIFQAMFKQELADTGLKPALSLSRMPTWSSSKLLYLLSVAPLEFFVATITNCKQQLLDG